MKINQVSPSVASTYTTPVAKTQEEATKVNDTKDVAVVYEHSNNNEELGGLYTASATYAAKQTTYDQRVADALGLDKTEKATFKKVWSFLRNDMGLTKKQAAGVCGNIYAESHFAADNAQDSSYPGDHNSDYKYKVKDGIGYGLLQWTYHSRKRGLKDMASDMEKSVSDVDVQLAYFKKEMTSDFKKPWNKIKEATTVKESCDIFLEDIEMPAELNYKTRESYANTIYNCVK